MERTPIIQIRDMCKNFPGVQALKGVKLDLYPGEVHALVGENGAGKSTLIKIISGVYDYTEGSYKINGKEAQIRRPLDAIAQGISVIYQELNLVPSLSIAENVYFGRLPQKSGKVQNLFRVIEDLKKNQVAILYVSHKLEEIFQISNRISIFWDGVHIDTVPVDGIDEQRLIEKMETGKKEIVDCK